MGQRIHLADEEGFTLGGMRVDPCSLTVSMLGSRCDLQPRVMKVLIVLARARPAVVSRDRLAELCWDGRLVGGDALNRCILALRHMAKELPSEPFAIETVPRVGYRLREALSKDDLEGLSAPFAENHVRSEDGEGLSYRPAEGKNVLAQLVSRRAVIISGAAFGGVSAAGLGWAALRWNSIPDEARILIDDARNSLYQFTPDQIENSIGKLRRATTLAPDSAEAWGLLALAYANSTLTSPHGQHASRLARSRASRKRAFSIEPHQPDALAAELGTSRVFANWYGQEVACRAALRRHPEHPVLHVALGHVLLEVGRFEEALPLFETSLQKTPLCVTSLLCRIIILSGLERFEECDAAVAHAFALMPRQPAIWFARLHYLAYTGRAGEAASMASDVRNRPMGIPNRQYDLAEMHAKSLAGGDRTLIRKTMEAYGEAARHGIVLAENAALFAAFVGHADESFRILDALYFNRGFRIGKLYPADGESMYSGNEQRTNILFRQAGAAVRRHRRFGLLTEQLGLEAYWKRTQSRSNIVA